MRGGRTREGGGGLGGGRQGCGGKKGEEIGRGEGEGGDYPCVSINVLML